LPTAAPPPARRGRTRAADGPARTSPSRGATTPHWRMRTSGIRSTSTRRASWRDGRDPGVADRAQPARGV